MMEETEHIRALIAAAGRKPTEDEVKLALSEGLDLLTGLFNAVDRIATAVEAIAQTFTTE